MLTTTHTVIAMVQLLISGAMLSLVDGSRLSCIACWCRPGAIGRAVTGPARTSADGGIGLRLFTVQKIAHAHNGSIARLDGVPCGLIARLRLPQSMAPQLNTHPLR
jgi:hypothetical protein